MGGRPRGGRLDLEAFLEAFSGDDSDILIWRFEEVDRLPYREIGKRLGRGASSVQRRYEGRVLPALRAALPEYKEADDGVPRVAGRRAV